jgi:hypothetical protein
MRVDDGRRVEEEEEEEEKRERATDRTGDANESNKRIGGGETRTRERRGLVHANDGEESEWTSRGCAPKPPV